MLDMLLVGDRVDSIVVCIDSELSIVTTSTTVSPSWIIVIVFGTPIEVGIDISICLG